MNGSPAAALAQAPVTPMAAESSHALIGPRAVTKTCSASPHYGETPALVCDPPSPYTPARLRPSELCSPARGQLSPAAAEMFARSVRGWSVSPASANVIGSMGDSPRKRAGPPLLKMPSPSMYAAEQLLHSPSVSDEVRYLYISMQEMKTLPLNRSSLGQLMQRFRERYRCKNKRRPLHDKEVQLLA